MESHFCLSCFFLVLLRSHKFSSLQPQTPALKPKSLNLKAGGFQAGKVRNLMQRKQKLKKRQENKLNT